MVSSTLQRKERSKTASADYIREVDTLRPFFLEARSYPLLTPEQEQQLAREAQAGNRRAVERLVECNIRLAVRIAYNYAGLGIDLADLVQEGCIGLWRAAELFEPRGFRFSTFAVKWIRLRVVRSLQNDSRFIRIPAYAHKELVQVKQSRNRLMQEQQPSEEGDSTTAAAGEQVVSRLAVAVSSGIDEERVAVLERTDAAVASLDEAKYGEEEDLTVTLIDEAEDTERTALTAVMCSEIDAQLRTILTDQEYFILTQHRIFGKSLIALGKHLGMSHEAVRRREIAALRKLRSSKALRELAAEEWE
jgi:RNA polymerase sigma factor (sigma-70 family)